MHSSCILGLLSSIKRKEEVYLDLWCFVPKITVVYFTISCSVRICCITAVVNSHLSSYLSIFLILRISSGPWPQSRPSKAKPRAKEPKDQKPSGRSVEQRRFLADTKSLPAQVKAARQTHCWDVGSSTSGSLRLRRKEKVEVRRRWSDPSQVTSYSTAVQ